MQSLSNIFRAPSTQKSDKNYRSSFSLYTSNGSIIKNDISTCNIPRPLRYSFRSSESKSNIMDSARTDYESLKNELEQRNLTILSLQSEIQSLKSKHSSELQSILSQPISAPFNDFQVKLDSVIKENEELSK